MLITYLNFIHELDSDCTGFESAKKIRRLLFKHMVMHKII